MNEAFFQVSYKCLIRFYRVFDKFLKFLSKFRIFCVVVQDQAASAELYEFKIT